MLIVVDANVIISALINKGITFKVFKHNASLKKFEFIAPEFLLSETNMNRLLSLTRLTKVELDKTFASIVDQIEFIPFSKFSDKFLEAIELNLKDSPYLALALKFNCPIFSGDKGLKEQGVVNVFSPRELLDILGIK